NLYNVVVWTKFVESTLNGTELRTIFLGTGLYHACDGLKLRGYTPQIASCEDCDNDLDRSLCQPLVLSGHSCVGSPEACPGFRVIRIGAHKALTRERLAIALDLLVSEPLLEGRHTKKVRC